MRRAVGAKEQSTRYSKSVFSSNVQRSTFNEAEAARSDDYSRRSPQPLKVESRTLNVERFSKPAPKSNTRSASIATKRRDAASTIFPLITLPASPLFRAFRGYSLFLVFALLALLLTVVASAAENPTPDAPLRVLSTVGQIRELTLEEASRRYPVNVSGVVTYLTTGEGYLQDETGGVFFRRSPSDPDPVPLTLGDRIQITGVTTPGSYSTLVEGTNRRGVLVTFLSHGALPEPRAISTEEFRAPSEHNWFVQVRGVIRSIEWGKQMLNLRFSTTVGMADAVVPLPPAEMKETIQSWENVEVTIRGVCSAILNGKGQKLTLQLRVGNLDLITPEWSLMQAYFDQPVRSVASLFRFNPKERPGGRVHLEGIVTFPRPGLGTFLRCADSGIWIESLQKTPLQIGTTVDVAGFPGVEDGKPVLLDGILHPKGKVVPPAPVSIRVSQAEQGQHDDDLVSIDGFLVEQIRQPDYSALFLESDGRRYYAELARAKLEDTLRRVRPQSWIRVTGICQRTADTPQIPEQAKGRFHILMRSTDDLAILRRPAWLTLQQLRWLLGGMLAVLTFGWGWAFLLRRQVAAQTATIAEKIQHAAVSEERTRIARELHDTLEQHLAGIAMLVDGVTARLPARPEAAREKLALVKKMLRHSQAEARRSVWELRSQSLRKGGLPAALGELADSLRNGQGPSIETEIRGTPCPLDTKTEFHLFRIAQEAVTNAVKHGGASRIDIALEYLDSGVTLSIKDNGRGFQPEKEPDGAHFGLLGIRERAGKIHAGLSIDSAPGEGTKVTARYAPQSDTAHS